MSREAMRHKETIETVSKNNNFHTSKKAVECINGQLNESTHALCRDRSFYCMFLMSNKQKKATQTNREHEQPNKKQVDKQASKHTNNAFPAVGKIM